MLRLCYRGRSRWCCTGRRSTRSANLLHCRCLKNLSLIGEAKQCYFYFHVFFINEENGFFQVGGSSSVSRVTSRQSSTCSTIGVTHCNVLLLILTHQDQHEDDHHDQHEDDHHEDDHQDQHEDDKYSHPQLPGVHGYWASTLEELREEPDPR